MQIKMIKKLHSDTAGEFLNIFELHRVKPDYNALCEIVYKYMLRVPFENISKIYYKQKSGYEFFPDIKLYLEGIEKYNFGGTCYANNYYLYLLLQYLGYEVKICGADMSSPDVHLVIILNLDGKEYLIDAGNAAPFLKPMPCDLNVDYVINHGVDKYILKPKDENGNPRMELYKNGQLKHGYTAKHKARDISEFSEIIAGSFGDDALFMNSLLLVKFFNNKTITINNYSFKESSENKTVLKELHSKEELIECIVKYFTMPEDIVSQVINSLKEFRNTWD